jgi:hypothetical protein
LDEEKSNHASLAQQSGFGPAFLYSLLRLVKARHLQKESVIDMNWQLLPVCHCPITIIGAGYMLLMVSSLFATPLLLLSAGLEKGK